MKPIELNRLLSTDQDDLLLLALVKGAERYVWLYSSTEVAELRRSFGRFAAHPELSFTWYDAAVLSHRLRERHGEVA
jgi:hypothetical protein